MPDFVPSGRGALRYSSTRIWGESGERGTLFRDTAACRATCSRNTSPKEKHDQPTITQYTISDFAEWELSKQLELTPRFQRRSVWPDRAKSYFIDTVLRGLPCPPLFIRASIDAETFRSVREVVDGQQRLRTVLGYIGRLSSLARA